MVALQYIDTLGTGVEAFDLALADLGMVSSPHGQVLTAVTGSGGGLVTWSVAPGGPVLADMTNISANARAGQRPHLLDLGDNAFVVTGVNGNTITRAQLDDVGAFVSMQTITGVEGAVQSADVALVADNTLVLTGPARTNAMVHDISVETGDIGTGVALKDTDSTHADRIGAVAAGTGTTRNVLLVGSQSEYGVTAYAMEGGLFVAGDSIGPKDGLGIMVPTAIAVLEVTGHSYAIIASATGSDGGAGALSVLEIGANGALTPTDHILDTRDSRFGGAQCVAGIEIGERGFVVAGGGDHGLSLFTLTRDGLLVHLQSIADTPSIGLGGAIDVELAVNCDWLEIFVITEEDTGIAHFRVGIGALGTTIAALDSGETLAGGSDEDLMIGGAGRDNLHGGSGDDVLIDGAEDDRLSGGDGADLFVLVQDGTRDVITDFNPAQDRIDLSGWAFLHDTSQLLIEERGGHTRVSFRDERLDVNGSDRGLVDPESLRAAILLDVNRAFRVPEIKAQGSAAGDHIVGSWGADTLMGRDGDDTIEGLQGDDHLNGGGGQDRLILNSQSNDVTIVDRGEGAFDLHSSTGVDHAREFEFYEFRNETLNVAQMLERAVPAPAVLGVVSAGTDGDDELLGDIFDDTLMGQGGDDRLGGNTGNDSLVGGAGDDTLIGNTGDDILNGGLDDDRLAGGMGNDLLNGGAGRNRLSGQQGNDSLHGGDQRDILNGGSGDDETWGYESNDRLVGGRGDDSHSGGAGPDKLYGNADHDLLDGGTGDDLLNGGGGNDTLAGGLGNDFLKGGPGGDVFIYRLGEAQDRIVDFDPAQDILMFSEDILAAYESAQDLIDDVASITSAGVIFDFEGSDRLILSNLSDLEGLADAIHFD